MNYTIRVFDYDDIASLRRMVQAHSTISLPNGYMLNVYNDLDKEKVYVIGVVSASDVDVSSSSVITIVDPITERPVAEIRSAHMHLSDFYETLRYIVTELTPKAILCIEKRNNDIIMLHKLEDSELKDKIYTGTDVKGKDNPERGMYLSRKERDTLFKILKGFVSLDKEKIVTSYITEDISKAVYSKNHIECGNSLRSYLLALHVIRHSSLNRLRGLSLNEIPEPVELKTIALEYSLRHGVSMAEGKTSKHINRPDTPSISDASDVDTRMIVNPVSEQDALIKIAPETQDEEPLEYYGAVQFIQARPEISNGQQGYSIMSYTDIESDIFKKINAWVPQDIFNNRFSKNGEFSFSHALQALKRGHDVARSGWNGTDMYITIIKAGNAAHKGFPMQDCLALKNNRGEMQPGWVPSQGDMLALDWRIVK